MQSGNSLSRRAFLKGAMVVVSAPFFVRNLFSAPASRTIYHASVGGSGMAASDLETITRHDFVKLVAVADVDLNNVQRWKQQYPEIKVYQDWRQMLEEVKEIDTLNVSTPDHMHGPAAMAAMQLGKHVYVQKPLTHDIYETRRLTEVARQKKLVTQMGIQIHSTLEYRLAVRLIQDGVIGKVKEVYSWSNKKWGDTDPLPDRSDPIPANFNWDLWLGVCEWRPFIGNGYYHPANWRKRLDFGTGTFGDMGCHIFDPVFKSLELTAPITVRSDGPAPNKWNWAINAVIHYVFPGTKYTEGKTILITWYDGDEKPPKEVQALVGPEPIPGQGSIFIGTKGVMLLPHIAKPRLFPQDQFKDFAFPKVETANHYTQFLEAVRNNGKTWAGFDYSGPLTESVLLGSVATRFPKTTLEWDWKGLKFTNVKEANQYIRRRYREGWKIKGL
ncbi:MAG: Gfo/Idh/MocA family protein [Limisphaerales bacterium]